MRTYPTPTFTRLMIDVMTIGVRVSPAPRSEPFPMIIITLKTEPAMMMRR